MLFSFFSFIFSFFFFQVQEDDTKKEIKSWDNGTSNDETAAGIPAPTDACITQVLCPIASTTAAATMATQEAVADDTLLSNSNMSSTASSNDGITSSKDTETTSDALILLRMLLPLQPKSDTTIEELIDDYIRSSSTLQDVVVAIDTTPLDELFMLMCKQIFTSCQHLPFTSVGTIDQMAAGMVSFLFFSLLFFVLHDENSSCSCSCSCP